MKGNCLTAFNAIFAGMMVCLSVMFLGEFYLVAAAKEAWCSIDYPIAVVLLCVPLFGVAVAYYSFEEEEEG